MNEVLPTPGKGGEAPVVNLIPGVIERPSKLNHQPFFSSILFFFLFLFFNKPGREACIFIFFLPYCVFFFTSWSRASQGLRD